MERCGDVFGLCQYNAVRFQEWAIILSTFRTSSWVLRLFGGTHPFFLAGSLRSCVCELDSIVSSSRQLLRWLEERFQMALLLASRFGQHILYSLCFTDINIYNVFYKTLHYLAPSCAQRTFMWKRWWIDVRIWTLLINKNHIFHIFQRATD